LQKAITAAVRQGSSIPSGGNVDKAVVGINHIALLTTEPGAYNNCTMTLTDYSNNQNQPLQISSFVVVSKS
jgi:hypothetical protein